MLRNRRDRVGALVALADGRYAVTGAGLVAIGGRRALAGLVRAAGRSGRVDACRACLVAGGHRRPDRREGAQAGAGGRGDLGVSGSGVVGAENGGAGDEE